MCAVLCIYKRRDKAETREPTQERRNKRGRTREEKKKKRRIERWRKGEGVAVIQRHTQRREKKRKEEIEATRDR